MNKVSICMPVYNGAVWLAEAMESCLAQSYKNIEVVLVNDGSTDSTDILGRFYAERPNVTYITQENKGIGAARKAAVEASKGDFIAVMDADDVMHPDRIKKSLEGLKKANVDVVYSDYFQADEHGAVQQGQTCCPEVTKESLLANNSAPHVTILAKRKCFVDNGYEEWTKVNDDALLLAKWFIAGYKFAPIHEPLMLVRYHPSSTSATRDKEVRKVGKKIEAMLNAV